MVDFPHQGIKRGIISDSAEAKRADFKGQSFILVSLKDCEEEVCLASIPTLSALQLVLPRGPLSGLREALVG